VSMNSKHARVSTSLRVECSPVSELLPRPRFFKLVKVLNAGIEPVNTKSVGDVSMTNKHARVSTSVRVECSPVSELESRSRKSKLVKVLNAGIVPVNTRRKRCW